MKPIVFLGSASTFLGRQIISHQHFETGKHQLIRFDNSEIKIKLESQVSGRTCFVIQSISNPANERLVELLFMLDALEREGADKIAVVIPYFGYARQNIQHQKGECVSMNVVVKILESLKTDEVVTVDLHDEGSKGIFSIALKHLSALPLLAEKVYSEFKKIQPDESQILIGSPDQGGIERARFFAQAFYQRKSNQEIVVVEKERVLSAVHQSRAIELYGQVKNQSVILVDDIATSGRTIINAAELCLTKGAKDVYAIIIHADFAKGVADKLQQSSLKKIYTTNSIEQTIDDLKKYSKIELMDISKIFKLNN